MHKIISYPLISKVSRLSAASCLIMLGACTTLNESNQGGQGSFRVNEDGKPATSKRFSWVTNNWQELSNSLKSTNTSELSIEINQVHDGSLRILIPADEIFVGNTLRINRKSHSILNKIVEEMNSRQELRVRIVGHTDSSGDDLYNQILSLNRSNSVAKYLISESLRSSRIELEGRGSIDPLVSNDSRENRITNRRIELYLYHLK
ncbi:MAG: OmpA family protein [Alcaligenaceae bacterium]|nr:OmpA family protein [Alcaligenaceae bacterium]